MRARYLLDALLERKGRIGSGDTPVGREINLLLPRPILGVGGDDIHIDSLEGPNDLGDEGTVEIVAQGGEDLDAGVWRCAGRSIAQVELVLIADANAVT